MTRINVISPKKLCDQHLLSEHRELTRIPNYIMKKNGNVKLSNLKSYTLGKGHVIFFRNKLLFLYLRYIKLNEECINRGFLVKNRWPKEVKKFIHLWHDYQITNKDILINEKRIIEKMPLKPRFTKHLKKQF
ncbi:MAG: pyrimidine dimer DNA glycosylase/endonuclease V [Arsenophonus sp.]|nr:MAG: pyrimidine dimer DNA glycosylase/endonuclease V [Arsenophonus sp.]